MPYLKNLLTVTALAFSLPALADSVTTIAVADSSVGSEIRLSTPGQNDWCLGTGNFTDQSGTARPPMDGRAITGGVTLDNV